MICKIETDRFLIEIISTNNWKHGEPINPKIPKWLVKVTDKFTHDEFFPHNHEFDYLTKTMDNVELVLLSWALNIKERHNLANLKNAENRPIENHIHKLAKEADI